MRIFGAHAESLKKLPLRVSGAKLFSMSTKLFRIIPILLFSLIGCGKGKGEIEVWNKTGQAILEGRLKVGPNVFELSGLKNGNSRAFFFQSSERSTSSYQLSLILGKRQKTQETIGAINNDMDYHDIMTIDKEFLSLDSSQNPAGNKNVSYKGTQSKKLKWY